MQDCGDCKACCGKSLIQEINGETFDNNTKCNHISCNGCDIYINRPQLCKQYNCGWKLDDSMPLWMRPDKSKTLINHNTKEALLWKGHLIDYIVPLGKKIPSKAMDYLMSQKKPFRFLSPKNGCKNEYTIGVFGTNEFKEFVEKQGLPI